MEKKIPLDEQIRIIVPYKKKGSQARIFGEEAGKGVLKPPMGEEFLPRRLQAEIFINFYDLGYYAVEDYFETNDTIYQPEIITAVGESTAIYADYQGAEADDAFEALDASIFDVELENFPQAFFKIYKGNPDFEKTITVAFPREGDASFEARLDNEDLPEWKTGGLQLSPAQAESLVIKPESAVFNSIELDLGAMTDLKATLTRDYEADPVAFTPSPRMDIFLVPTLIYALSEITYAKGLMTGVDFSDYRQHRDLLAGTLAVLPRDVVLGELLEFFDNFGSFDDYQQKYRYTQAVKQFPEPRAARRIREVDETSNPTIYNYFNDAMDWEDFPFADIFEPDAPNNTSEVFELGFSINFSYNNIFSEGIAEITRLKAVLKKDGVFYYIWRTD